MKFPIKSAGRFALLLSFLFIGMSSIFSQTPPFENCTDCDGCVFPAVANNPDLNVQCQEGFNIAFILDESGSIATPASSPAPQQVRDGVLTFLENLNCTDVNVGFIEFSSAARLVSVTGTNYVPITDGLITNMEAYFNGAGLITDPSTYNPADGNFLSFFEKGTNWQDAMDKVGDLGRPDMILFFTDGIPTVWGLDQTYNGTTIGPLSCNNPTTTQDPEIVNAIDYANYYKGLNTHMFMMGVGNNVDVAQAQLMSGTTEYDVSDPDASFRTTDYLIETDFSLLAERLQAFALDLCPVIVSCEANDACAGADAGSITATMSQVAGAALPFSYTYTGPANGSGTVVLGTAVVDITDLPPGDYVVTVTEGSGTCERIQSCEVTIGQSPAPTCTTSNIIEESGSGGNASFDVTVTGGTPQYSYTIIETGATGTITTDGGSATIGGLSSGSYTVQVEDLNGCTSTCIAAIASSVADLELQKTVSNATPAVCDTITFTLAVENKGPADATGVEITDIVPAGFGNIHNISNGGMITTGSTIVWSGLSLANGDIANLTFDVKVLPGAAASDYVNSAEVTGSDQDDPDSTPGNNDPDEDDQDSETVIPMAIADLELEKVVSSSTPLVCDTITFTIALTNKGPSPATGVSVGDEVPAGFVNIHNISGGGTLSGSTITWSGLNLAVNETVQLTFDCKVAPNLAASDYVNSAQVTGSDQDDPDSTPGNNDPNEDDQDDETVIPMAIADLELEKVVSSSTPFVCDTITFTIAVTNQGPSPATGVSVGDEVPAGFVNIHNISGGGTLSGSTISWSGLNLAVNETVQLTFDCKVAPNLAASDYVNSAQVTGSDQDDPDSTPGNNDPDEDDQDEEPVAPVQEADLSLQKIASETSPMVGDVITYTISVQNAGPSDATGVEISDVVPNGLSGVTNIMPAGMLTGNTITWTGLSIGVGQEILLTYNATVEAPAPGVSHKNTAQVTGSDQEDPDSDPDNNDPTEDDQDDEELCILSAGGCPSDLVLACGSDFDQQAMDWIDASIASILANSYSSDSEGITVTHDYQAPVEWPCDEASGVVVTFTITDNCPNEVTCEALIYKQDAIAPVLSGIPGELTIPCDSDLPPWPEVSATDNCDGEVEVSRTQVPGFASCGGQFFERRYSAVDACGNRSSGGYTIYLQDVNAPLLEVPADLSLECGDLIPEPTHTVTDDCSSVTVNFEESRVDDGPCSYTITRTWTATDGCGNRTVQTQTIGVNDTQAPVVTLTDPMLAGITNGQTFRMEGCEQPQMLVSMASYADCCPAALQIEPFDRLVASNVCDVFGYRRQWRCGYEVTDAAGNMTVFEFFVEQYDVTGPELIGIPANLTMPCNGIVAEAPLISAIDDCSGSPEVQFTESLIGDTTAGYAMIRTWSAGDACGNVTSQSQVISLCDFDAAANTGHLGNTVWMDDNANGLQEEDEEGVNGIMVYLLKKSAARNNDLIVVDSMQTVSLNGIKGQYGFDWREPGEYQIRFDIPSEFEFTAQDAGSNDMLDSDVNPDAGTIGLIDLVGGSDFSHLDAGLTANAVLPVELLSFTSSESDCKITLDWSTSSEINLERFEVQSSDNALDFTTMRTVVPTGGEDQITEYKVEENSRTGIHHYRLKMIDLDGSTEYSSITTAKVACEDAISVFPNPTSRILDVQYSTETDIRFRLLNELGQELDRGIWIGGQQQQQIDLMHFPPGVFHLHIISENGNKAIKVLKKS